MRNRTGVTRVPPGMRWGAGLLLVAAVAVGCGDRVERDRLDHDRAGVEPGSRSTGWERLPDGPLSGRTGAVMAAVGDRVYVFGGWQATCPPDAYCVPPDKPLLADGAALDTGTKEWSPIADAPYGLRHAGTAALDGDIYVLTTCRDDPQCGSRPELLRYHPEGDTWAELGALPRADVYLGLLATNDEIMAVSGSDEQGEEDDQLYDPASGRWTELPDDPLPSSSDRFAVADGDRVLVFGSPRVGPEEEAAAKVGAAYDLRTGEWTRLPDAPGDGHQVWRSGDRAFLNTHGGPNGGGTLDLTTDTWTRFPVRAGAERDRRYGLAGLIDDERATYGYADGWAYDASDDSWVLIGGRTSTVFDESRAAVGRSLVLFGGQDWRGQDGVSGRGRLVSETWLWTPPS